MQHSSQEPYCFFESNLSVLGYAALQTQLEIVPKDRHMYHSLKGLNDKWYNDENKKLRNSTYNNFECSTPLQSRVEYQPVGKDQKSLLEKQR